MSFPWNLVHIIASTTMIHILSYNYFSDYVDKKISNTSRVMKNHIDSSTSDIKEQSELAYIKSSALESTLNSYCNDFNDKTSELCKKTTELSDDLNKLSSLQQSTITPALNLKPDTRILRYIKNTKVICASDSDRSSVYDVDSYIISFSISLTNDNLSDSYILYELRYKINQLFSLQGFVADEETKTKTVLPASKLAFLQPKLIKINNEDGYLKEGNILDIYVHCTL